MNVQLKIEFETLLELVDQLNREETQLLLKHLQETFTQKTLTNDEFRVQFNSLMINNELVAPDESLRREDLYGDDGR